PSDGWYSFCLDRMIQTLFSLERYKEADDLINNGLERWNDFADYHCLKGMLLDHFGFRENARREFEQCIQLADKAEKKQSRFWLISPDYGRLIPYKKLAEIHGCRQDLPQTVYYLSKVLQQKPKDTACLYQISELLAAHEDGPSVAGFFAKIYPTQNPLHAKLLFQIFTLIGHADLSDHYYNQCLRNNMEPEPADLLRYHLLTRNHAKYNKLLQRYPELKNNENLIEYFHIAAMVWQDESYLPAPMPEAQNNDETSFHLSLLIHLYQLKMFEQFDQILTQVSSPALIHQLADYFYAHHQSELAVDYYLYLFDRGELQANGLRNIGIFYVNRGQLAEGLHFLRGCLEMNPQDCALYGMILSITDDQQLKEQIKQQFTERFPAIKNLSFMQQA
ncbi:MAG TPA: hypothetical protein VF260_00720, partial [Bacilli bacterium]